MALPGPSFAGPLGGWTSSTLAPVKTIAAAQQPTTDFRPQAQGTRAGGDSPFDFRSFEQASAGPDYDDSPAANQARLARAVAAEEAAKASGDPYQRQLAQQMLIGFTMQATPGDAAAKRAAGVAAEKAFIARNPGTTPRLSETAPSLRELVLGRGVPTQAISRAPEGAAAFSSSGGGGGGSDSSDSLGEVDPRVAQKPRTPLESLLAAIYPDAATPAAADPFADPRAVTKQPSVIETILGNLGASRGASQSGFVAGPSFSGPVSSASPVPSSGAQIAASIPGAPPFLASAINNVQSFNPLAQQPARATAGGGFDPLIGIAQISAEQRLQKAELEKDRADADAKFRAAQLKRQEQKNMASNMSRLKGFGASGWSGPAMPQY